MGRVHTESLRRLGNVDVVTIASASSDKARRLADRFGIERATSDVAGLLEDPTIDAVHICTPNARHYDIAVTALEAGKHVLCEKPLAISSTQASSLVRLAAERRLRNCTCHNLRYYPMVQQMRAMISHGDLGEVLIAHGTYSQDWLLHDTDWNWRIDQTEAGPLRAMADIGSHWCDLVEHVTGLRISSVCTDLATFHESRRRPQRSRETFAGAGRGDDGFDDVTVHSDDYGAVLFHLGRRARGSFGVSQVSAGRKNRLSLEIYGTKAGLTWNSERSDELWIGHRDRANELLVKDPVLMAGEAATAADLPGGHNEGYGDTFKQLFGRFYRSVADMGAAADYPQFTDGLRQMHVLEAALASHLERRWVDVTVDLPLAPVVL
jgi:predicted dehydrogenase